MDKYNCLSCINLKEIKRFFLIFPPFLTWFLIKYYNSINYSSIIVFLISIILFWNFPMIVTFSNSKPIYHEDLFLNSGALPKLDIEDHRLDSFKRVYTWIAIITNSVLTAVLFQYWIFKTQYTTSFYEILGVSGGILKIFQLVNQYTGILSLKLIKYNIRVGIIDSDDSDSYEIESDSNDSDCESEKSIENV